MTDLEIRNKVQLHYNETLNHFRERATPWVTMLFGSQNYGLETPLSDVDTKSMLIPSVKDIVLGREKISEDFFTSTGEVAQCKDFRKMFGEYLKGNINFLETLYTEWYVVHPFLSDFFIRLRRERDLIANAHPQRLMNMCAAMARQKGKMFSHPTPATREVINKHGYNPKELVHICRLECFMRMYSQGHKFEKCLRPKPVEAEFMRGLKLNPMELKQAEEVRDEVLDMVDTHLVWSKFNLPLEKDAAAAEEFFDDLTVDMFARLYEWEYPHD